MIRNVILDTGPIAALVNPRDQWHEWTCLQFDRIIPPLITCEAVLSEACFLVQRTCGEVAGVLNLFERGVIELGFALNDHFDEVAALMQRYTNVPMSLADACLVRMSELVADCVLLTVDSDFHIYRRKKRQRIPLVIPDET